MLVYLCAFFFNDTATTEIYTLSLHDALPISERGNWGAGPRAPQDPGRLRRALHLLRDDARAGRESVAGNPGTGSGSTDRKSTRLNSSHSQISYAVFCLKKKKKDYYDVSHGDA